jgi:hypothetical protein
MAGFGFLSVAGAGGVGIDATSLVGPLVLLPVGFMIAVVGGGHSPAVLWTSAVGGLAFAVAWAVNFVRASAVASANPGTWEASGGAVSIAFVLIGLAIMLWSAGAAGLISRLHRR